MLDSFIPRSSIAQADTDTYVLENPNKDLVEFMRTGGYYLSNRDEYFYEEKRWHRGLPELAQYWMVREGGGGPA